MSPDNAARDNVSRNAFFSWRSEKKAIFLDADIVVKKLIECLYSYRQRYASS